MKYAVIGSGAVGGYYGGRLALAGNDVHFLFRSDYGHVRSHGLDVQSYLGDWHLDPIHVYNSTEAMPKCDVILVCLKTTANDSLHRIISPILKDDSIIILVQNGIGVEADVSQMFPNHSIAAGIAFINAAKIGSGVILHKGYGHISLANYCCHDDSILEQVVSDFKQAGVKSRLADYHETRWRKAILNLATNGVTVVLNARCDELINNDDSRQLVHDLMLEGIHAANACGVSSLTDELADQMVENTRTTVFATSMKYDFDHGYLMEVKYLYTKLIEAGESHGCAMPKSRMLEQQLLYLNSKILSQNS